MMPEPRNRHYTKTEATVPWWIWVLFLHAFAVYMLYYGIYKGGWGAGVADRVIPLSLAHENNFAVWWSGACLFISGLLFFMLGARDALAMRDRVMWISLALVVLGLSLDEVGSLHERLSLMGGWWALLPFGVVGSAVFGFGIVRMLRQHGSRGSGLLVMISLGLFFSVAALEELESMKILHHNLARLRLLVEEAIELGGAFLLILAAVLQIRALTGQPLNRVSILVMPKNVRAFDTLVFVALLVHVAAAVLLIPDQRSPGRGNPEIWYPMAVFLLVSFHFLHVPFGIERRFVGPGMVASVFVALSMGQMYNFGEYFAAWFPNIIEESFYENWFTRVSATLLPVFLIAAFTVSLKTLLLCVLASAVLLVLLSEGSSYFEAYYLFSGIVAYMAYRLLVIGETSALGWVRETSKSELANPGQPDEHKEIRRKRYRGNDGRTTLR
tara:strand:+ start:215 stop:1537 length:1323 start_codon:yes stop_codon:yes gene_type:complete